MEFFRSFDNLERPELSHQGLGGARVLEAKESCV